MKKSKSTTDLITADDYQHMTPMAQGYVQYMQGAREGSELKDKKNPYRENTPAWEAWNEGQKRAAIHAQEGDD